MLFFDATTSGEGLQWLGLLSGAIGLSGIIIFALKRVFGGRDAQKKIRESNNEHQLDFDTGLRDDLWQRITAVEADNKELRIELKSVQKDITSQMIENAKIVAESENVKKDNTRMEAEILELRKLRRADAELIAKLRSELDALKLIVSSQHTGNPGEDPLKVRLVDEQGKDK